MSYVMPVIIGGVVVGVVAGPPLVKDYYGAISDALSYGNGITGTDAASIASRNAIAHAYTSALLYKQYGASTAEYFADLNERYQAQFDDGGFDQFRDLYNNEVGRRIAEWAITNGFDSEEEIASLIMDAYGSGNLITTSPDERFTNNDTADWSSPSDLGWASAAAPPVDYVPILKDYIRHDLEKIVASVSNFVQDLKSLFGLAETTASPLILDLNGDGVQTTSLTGSNAVYWDIDNDGFREASGWVSADDGLLVRDLNSNGVIDNHSELFGTTTTDGFTVLTALDSNSDNAITSADTDWNSLMVWQDSNGDGISQSDELHTLGSLGITSISLADSTVSETNNGNNVTHRSTFVMNGQTHNIDDVWFSFDNTNSVDTRSYTFDPDTLLLPELRGYGEVSTMSIAMSNDATLKGQMQTIASADLDTLFSAAFGLEGKMSALMLRWAGADTVTPGSRGAYFDAQKLTFLEKMLGQPYNQLGSSNPLGGAVTPILQQAWDTAYNAIVARVLFQSAGHQLFSTAPVYNYATDSFSGSWALDSAFIASQTSGMSMAELRFEWASIFKMIDAIQGVATLTPAQKADIDAAIIASDPSGQLDFGSLAASFNMPSANLTVLTGAGDTASINSAAGTIIHALAGAGNDTLSGWEGNDVLAGGDGDDVLDMPAWMIDSAIHPAIRAARA